MADAAIFLLVTGNLLLLCLAGIQSRRLRRLDSQQSRLRGEFEVLQRELGALCTGASGVGGHLSRIDLQLRRLYERQDRLELNESAPREYDHAAKLIRGGADVEKVMEECGLVRAEAELLMLLHRRAARGDVRAAP